MTLETYQRCVEKFAQRQRRRADGGRVGQARNFDSQVVAEGREDTLRDDRAYRIEKHVARLGEIAPEQDQLWVERIGDRDGTVCMLG